MSKDELRRVDMTKECKALGKRDIFDEDGAAIVIIALIMTALLSFSALVIDVGLLYLERVRLSNAMDSASLAGVQHLPDDPEGAVNRAMEYAVLNGADPDGIDIAIMADNTMILIDGVSRVPGIFSRLFGITESIVTAGSAAKVGYTKGIRGTVPFGVVNRPFEYGIEYVLKFGEGSDQVSSGNFGALALGGTGSAIYMDNIMYGYDEYLEVGDWVPTEPGNMSGPTMDGVSYRLNLCPHTPKCTWDTVRKGCPRIILVPIVDGFGNGRGLVNIIGFSAFFLEDVSGSGKSCNVVGRFLRYAVDGEIGADSYYGLRSFRLIQ
jgi:Flp pilus assembly protein TadG